MFSKSKKSKEKARSSSKDGTEQGSPSRSGPFSSMSASLPKNIFSSGRSRRSSGGSANADAKTKLSTSPQTQVIQNNSVEPMHGSYTLGHTPAPGYYFDGLGSQSSGSLSGTGKSPYNSPTNTAGRTSSSSLKMLKEKYDREQVHSHGHFMSDRSLEKHMERLQMLSQGEQNGSSPNINRDRHNHTMSASYTRDRSLDREYPHMGARSLERDHHYTPRSRSTERPDYTTQLYNQEMRNFRDALILELQGQIADLNKECAKLQQESESTKEKLSSSMNSIKTFWSPELKKERAMRKEESARHCLLNEQLKVAQAELKKQSSTIRDLESQVSLKEDAQASSQISQQEIAILQQEKDKQAKEILILRKTVDEMELRIETQKQTLGARDESMKKLLEMLQNKGHSVKNIEENQAELEQLQTHKLETGRKIKQLQNELSQKESETTTVKEENSRLMDELEQIKLQLKQQPASAHTLQAMLEAKDSRISALEKEVQSVEDKLIRSQEDGGLSDSNKKEGSLKDSLSTKEKHLRAEIQNLKKDIVNKDTEIAGYKLKAETLRNQQSENQQYIGVLKDQVAAKEKHLAMLQAEIDDMRDRLKERDSTIDKKAQKSHSLQSEKRRIETEIAELKDHIDIKERKIGNLQRKIDTLEEEIIEKDQTISQLRLAQTSMETTASNAENLEEIISEKEKQIEKLKEQRDKTESEHQEECDMYIHKNQDLKNQLDKLQIELSDKQTELCELREKTMEAGSEKFQIESKVRQLERDLDQKTLDTEKLKVEIEELKKSSIDTKNVDDIEKQLSEMTNQVEQARNEANNAQAEVDKLRDSIKTMETEKTERDTQMKEMQEIIKEYKQKMGTLKRSQQMEKKKSAHLLEEARKREGDLSEDAFQLKDAVIAKSDRIEELEEALKESVKITAEREMVMADQQQQLEEAEKKVDDLTMEIARMKSSTTDHKVAHLTKLLDEKDHRLKKLQSERHRHLEEVFEMKQEAIQAAISEKDANIALLEMTSTKQRKNTEEIEKLNKEKEKLQQQLKEVTQNRMKLIQKQERRGDSLGRSKKSSLPRTKGLTPEKADPYVLTAPESLDS